MSKRNKKDINKLYLGQKKRKKWKIKCILRFCQELFRWALKDWLNQRHNLLWSFTYKVPLWTVLLRSYLAKNHTAKNVDNIIWSNSMSYNHQCFHFLLDLDLKEEKKKAVRHSFSMYSTAVELYFIQLQNVR